MFVIYIVREWEREREREQGRDVPWTCERLNQIDKWQNEIRSWDYLISIMGIPILVRWHPSIATAPIHITETLWSASVRHWSDTFASDRCLTDIDPTVLAIFAVWGQLHRWKIVFCFRGWYTICDDINEIKPIPHSPKYFARHDEHILDAGIAMASEIWIASTAIVHGTQAWYLQHLIYKVIHYRIW